ncbi:MAG TPA: J domain-containing protein [Terracidiphilus sp.]|nr:J domain-containing protein [Terracidiphilus sp.]
MSTSAPIHDYYEFLQISPNADAETIHRVYRFLAARLHPDNAETGHEENFRLLKAAYDVLSDPRRRAEYDESRAKTQPRPEPLAASIDFMDVMEGELNRRLAVLAVLYYRRRTNPTYPEVPLSEIEERMGFPRDYLDFTLWYLQKKGYVAKADNAQYTLSVDGVDFVENQRSQIPTLHKLLTSGSGSSVEDLARTARREPVPAAPEPAATAPKPSYVRPDPRLSGKYQPQRPSGPIILPSSMSEMEDRRRLNRPDRRVGKPDLRDKKVERRFHFTDRREDSQVQPTPGTPLLISGDS